jgi:hypothetical protein
MVAKNDEVWLLQNGMNPFPVAADLALDGSQLRIVLPPAAADAVTRWLERSI